MVKSLNEFDGHSVRPAEPQSDRRCVAERREVSKPIEFVSFSDDVIDRLARSDRIPGDGVFRFEIVKKFVREPIGVFEIVVFVLCEKSPGGIENETLAVSKNAAKTAKIILNEPFQYFINLLLCEF